LLKNKFLELFFSSIVMKLKLSNVYIELL
jgi:hypothetical protein